MTPTKRDEMPDELQPLRDSLAARKESYEYAKRSFENYFGMNKDRPPIYDNIIYEAAAQWLEHKESPAPADGELREALQRLIEMDDYNRLRCVQGYEDGSPNGKTWQLARKALEKHAAAIQKSQDSK